MLIEEGFIDLLERQHTTDAGIQIDEVDPTEALLQLVGNSPRVAQRPSIRLEDNDLLRQTPLCRRQCLGVGASDQDGISLLMKQARRREANSSRAASDKCNGFCRLGRHVNSSLLEL